MEENQPLFIIVYGKKKQESSSECRPEEKPLMEEPAFIQHYNTHE